MKGRFRILHLIASIDPRDGGPVEALVQQDAVMRPHAHREVASLDLPDAPWLAGFPMTVHALGGRSWLSRLPGLRRYRYSERLAPWLRAHAGDYDLIVVHGLWSYVNAAARRVLTGGPTPYVGLIHGMLDPWFRRAYPLKHWLKQAFYLAVEGPLLAGARAVLFTTEEERRQARGVFSGLRFRSRIAPYGTAPPPRPTVDQTEAFLRACPGARGRPYLLFLGRLHPKKGCDLLIDAFAREATPNLQLVMAGPDQVGWSARLRDRAARLGVGDRVHWPGAIFGEAKWGAFHGAEAFVLTSHQENFGVSVAEALACGKPALISDKVNICREIETAGAGLVAPDTDAGARDLLRRWRALDPGQRRVMGAAALRLFNERFEVRRSALALLDALREQAA